MSDNALSIIIPVYNEAAAIKTTIQKCSDALKDSELTFELIAVNDCSTDKTGEILDQCKQDFDFLQVINQPVNGGYGRALKSGINMAKNEIICILDADATYDPKYIPKFFKEFSQGLDLLIGQRSGEHFQGNFIKSFMRKMYAAIIHFVLGEKVPDANSGLRMFKKSQITNYFPHLCNGFSFTTSQTLIMYLEGFFVKFTPIEYPERAGETKVRLFRDSLRTLQFITQIVIRYNPLKLFLLLATPVFIIMLLSMGLYTFSNYGNAVKLGVIFWYSSLIFSILISASIISYAIISKGK